MALSSLSSSDRISLEARQTGAGNIRDVSERLLLWAKRDGGSLAQVEYVSEFARQRVEQRLRDGLLAAGVAITSVELPTRRPATEIVEYLLTELAQVPSGVVLVTGFATAFESQVPLEDALRIVNFNREALIAFPLRQVWWMTPVVVQRSLHAMPDLHGWFSPKLRLSERVEKAHLNARSAVGQANLLGVKSAGNADGPASSLDDARQRSQGLLAQFAAAKAAGAEDMALLTTYLLPALEALADVGAQKELRDLTLRFEGLLGSLKLSKSPEVATGISRLAELYRDQGRYSEAEPLCLQALQLRKVELGDRHPSTATSLNNLALLYQSQGRYDEAEPLYVEALEIYKAELGDRHPSTATSLNNLAGLYESQGHYGEAEPLLVEAIEIWKAELGDRHPSTATSLNNLAELYRSQGRYSEAEPLLIEALEVTKAELGDHHPSTAASLNNLAGLYKSQGRYAEAEPLYVEALEICKAELGNRHPSTAAGLNNLALLYRSQGRYVEAEPLYIEALKIWKAELGDRHPDTADSLFNLAALYHNTQRHQQALSHIQQALEVYLSVLGSDHPTTQLAMSWLKTIQQALNE